MEFSHAGIASVDVERVGRKSGLLFIQPGQELSLAVVEKRLKT